MGETTHYEELMREHAERGVPGMVQTGWPHELGIATL